VLLSSSLPVVENIHLVIVVVAAGCGTAAAVVVVAAGVAIGAAARLADLVALPSFGQDTAVDAFALDCDARVHLHARRSK